MPIRVDKDELKHLTIFTVRGELNFKELLDYMKSYHEDYALTQNCVWDFRSATGGEVISEDLLGYFASIMKQYAFESPVSKMGFIIVGDLGFGLARMLSTFEELYDVTLDAKAFLSMEEAVSWLDKD